MMFEPNSISTSRQESLKQLDTGPHKGSAVNGQSLSFHTPSALQMKPSSFLSDLQKITGDKDVNLRSLIPEPLSPAKGGLDIPDAMPIIKKSVGPRQEGGGAAFRYGGFGKYRLPDGKSKRRLKSSDKSKQGAEDDGEETDGQFDATIDADGSSCRRGRCKHRRIEGHKCLNCDFELAKFGSFFDSGVVPNYLRILQCSNAEECSEQLGKDLDLIYESFVPTNIIQMRDMQQTLIGRQLRSAFKKEFPPPSLSRLLSKEAVYSDAVQHVPQYEQYLKDLKEQKQNVFKTTALFIDSHFESGNIEKVFKSRCSINGPDSQEYHLFMSMDTNTRGHQQWFFFRVRNMKKGTKYKFNLWNFTKPKSLYKTGMTPMWRSKKKAAAEGIEDEQEQWEFIPSSSLDGPVQYSKSNFTMPKEKKGVFEKLFEEDRSPKEGKDTAKDRSPKDNKESAKDVDKNQFVKKFGQTVYYYCLSFTVEFPFNDDTVFIAYSRPFTYTRICHDIIDKETALQDMDLATRASACQPVSWDSTCELTVPNLFTYTRKLLCLTLGGLPIPIITITAAKTLGKKLAKREAVIISSRVHPGETNSSFVFAGILEMITNPHNQIAQALREQFVFVLVPCLNPDGVVKGNYRSSFAGVDLNRQWIAPSQQLHPTIYATKEAIAQVHKERGVLLFCDLHGHSRKLNSFFYGCNRAANGGFNSWTKVRLLPRILAGMNHVFDLTSCKFKVEKSKFGTGRVVVWRQFEVTNSFTLENSFYGYEFGEEFKLFRVEDFARLGADILHSLYQYQRILNEIAKELTITRGWLKPKRLLEVTGQTAQERLKQEAKEKRGGRRLKPPTSTTLNDGDNCSPNPSRNAYHSQTQTTTSKPPKGPSLKLTAKDVNLTSLLDEYVNHPQTNKGRGPPIRQNSLAPHLEPVSSVAPRHDGTSSNGVPRRANSSSRMTSLSSKGMTSSKNESEKSKTVDKEARRQEVVRKLVKIQAFIRMIIARKKYHQLHEDEQERLLLHQTTITDSLADSTINLREDIKAENNDFPIIDSAFHSPTKQRQIKLQKKYIGQLNLEMIESEGVAGKISSAIHSSAGSFEKKRISTILDSTGSRKPAQDTIQEQENEALEESAVDSSAADLISKTFDNRHMHGPRLGISAAKPHVSDLNLDESVNPDSLTIQNSIQSSIPDEEAKVPEWRHFFSMEELTKAYDSIQKGTDPADDEVSVDDDGSESCPSDDNLEMKQLYDLIYCQKNKSAEVIKKKKDLESTYYKGFTTFVKKVAKKIREVSRDSHDMARLQHTHKDGQYCAKCAKKKRDLSHEANKRFMNLVHLDHTERQADKQRHKESQKMLSLEGKGQSIDPADRRRVLPGTQTLSTKGVLLGGDKRMKSQDNQKSSSQQRPKVGSTQAGAFMRRDPGITTNSFFQQRQIKESVLTSSRPKPEDTKLEINASKCEGMMQLQIPGSQQTLNSEVAQINTAKKEKPRSFKHPNIPRPGDVPRNVQSQIEPQHSSQQLSQLATQTTIQSQQIGRLDNSSILQPEKTTSAEPLQTRKSPMPRSSLAETGAQIASLQSSAASGVILKQKSGSPPEARVMKGSPLIIKKKSPTRVGIKKGSPTQSKVDVKKSPTLLSSKKALPPQVQSNLQQLPPQQLAQPQNLLLPSRPVNVTSRQIGLGSKSPGPTLQMVDNQTFLLPQRGTIAKAPQGPQMTMARFVTQPNEVSLSIGMKSPKQQTSKTSQLFTLRSNQHQSIPEKAQPTSLQMKIREQGASGTRRLGSPKNIASQQAQQEMFFSQRKSAADTTMVLQTQAARLQVNQKLPASGSKGQHIVVRSHDGRRPQAPQQSNPYNFPSGSGNQPASIVPQLTVHSTHKPGTQRPMASPSGRANGHQPIMLIKKKYMSPNPNSSLQLPEQRQDPLSSFHNAQMAQNLSHQNLRQAVEEYKQQPAYAQRATSKEPYPLQLQAPHRGTESSKREARLLQGSASKGEQREFRIRTEHRSPMPPTKKY